MRFLFRCKMTNFSNLKNLLLKPELICQHIASRVIVLWPDSTCEAHAYDYQTVHFFSGFIGVPIGQAQSLENALLLERAPITLNSGGE